MKNFPTRFALTFGSLLFALLIAAGCSSEEKDRSGKATGAAPTKGMKLVSAPKGKGAGNGESYLFALESGKGTLTQAKDGGDDAFTLTLAEADEQLTKFTDRPQHKALSIKTEDFLDSWDDAFGLIPPNAVLSYLAPNATKRDNVVFELTKPTYDAKQRVANFNAKWIKREKGDPTPPKTLSNPSLYIDDVQQPDSGDRWCSMTMQNFTNFEFVVGGYQKKSTDDWGNPQDYRTPSNLIGLAPFSAQGGAFPGLGTTAAPVRGCWEQLSLDIKDSSPVAYVALYVENPWKGSNVYSCKVTDPNKKYNLYCGYFVTSTVGGNAIYMNFFACNDDPQDLEQWNRSMCTYALQQSGGVTWLNGKPPNAYRTTCVNGAWQDDCQKD